MITAPAGVRCGLPTPLCLCCDAGTVPSIRVITRKGLVCVALSFSLYG